MEITAKTQAVLLLTAHFSKVEGAKPLTPTEWGRFATWLRGQSLAPEDLLDGPPAERLEDWQDKTVTPERLAALLARGSALALVMEKWQRSGLWVMTRADGDYPRRLKQRLGADSPALLFGCGRRDLLNHGGLAVVGSRHVSAEDLAYSRELGALAAAEGYTVVSGGAKGIDEAAMLGALEAEGNAVGVLADSLLRTSTRVKYRRHIMENRLALLSPFYPEAGFSPGNAMQRNKYIYCLADAAVAVHSGLSGGTWTGANENLAKQRVPLWVKQNDDVAAGNRTLVEAGAAWLPADIQAISVADLFQSIEKKPIESAADIVLENNPTTTLSELGFYELFLVRLQRLCAETPRTPEELENALQLHSSQLNIWLKAAVNDGRVNKFSRPVRYQWKEHKQAALFST